MSLAASAWILTQPIVPDHKEERLELAAGTDDSEVLIAGLPTLDELQSAAQVDLRPAPHDSRETEVEAPPLSPTPMPPPPRIRLAAIVIEQGRKCAVLLNEKGEILIRFIGEEIDDARVVDVLPDRVVLEHARRPVTLILPREEFR